MSMASGPGVSPQLASVPHFPIIRFSTLPPRHFVCWFSVAPDLPKGISYFEVGHDFFESEKVHPVMVKRWSVSWT